MESLSEGSGAPPGTKTGACAFQMKGLFTSSSADVLAGTKVGASLFQLPLGAVPRPRQKERQLRAQASARRLSALRLLTLPRKLPERCPAHLLRSHACLCRLAARILRSLLTRRLSANCLFCC